MRYDTLAEWLAWQETIHPVEMDLGLSRTRLVHEALGGGGPPPFPVVTVAGTNGKGSTVAFAQALLTAAGARTGTYTSPHLVDYNERIRIDGEPAPDAAIMTAFDRIDRARGGVTLTYFEFGTLAAVEVFRAARVDAAVLEVGIGGRLDAVNVFDADAAVVTRSTSITCIGSAPTASRSGGRRRGSSGREDPPSSPIAIPPRASSPRRSGSARAAFASGATSMPFRRAKDGAGGGRRGGSTSCRRLPSPGAFSSTTRPPPSWPSMPSGGFPSRRPSGAGSRVRGSRAASRSFPARRRSSSTSPTTRMRRDRSPPPCGRAGRRGARLRSRGSSRTRMRPGWSTRRRMSSTAGTWRGRRARAGGRPRRSPGRALARP